jgi:pyrimidine-nucleoside phosphorylase
VLQYDDVSEIIVDKHSTGGVGDKTTLVLAPLVASAGVPIAKLSGRGLGFTGGTLDKLESIPGFTIEISSEDFFKQVNEIGLAIIGQTADITPADKKLYALRDVTGTIESTPLIASSIMSKKLASGADHIVLDVKVGSGAFMKDVESATKLSNLMVSIGNTLGRRVVACLTDMSEPLGNNIGNYLEVIEAIETLNGKGPKDLEEVVLRISSHLVHLAKKTDSFESAYNQLKENLYSGKAYEIFKKFIVAQGGNLDMIENYESYFKYENIIEIKSEKSGYVNEINALDIGVSSMLLGAGRETKEDSIDHMVGIKLNKKVNDYVEKDDVLCYLYSNGRKEKEAILKAKEAFRISDTKVEKHLIIKEIL